MSSDQHLARAAKAMMAAAAADRPVVPVLRQLCPGIYRQLVNDGKYPGLLSLWGRCVNVDENAGQIIVHPAILQAIGQVAGVPMRGRVVHAGLQHTYGYLFSLIDTPYGRKRDRWVSTAWERGFGLDLSLFGARPRAGTLLANLTWFLGQIVYRGQPRSLRQLARNAVAAAPSLIGYDYSRLRVCRVAEQVAGAGDTRRKITLITDLVSFPHPAGRGENTLLIYSVQIGRQAAIKLITAFPIRSQVAREITASVAPHVQVPVRLRYNAYVPGLYGRTLRGRRSFSGPLC